MDKDNRLTGRVTIPTDVDVVSDTLKLMERWGADALRAQRAEGPSRRSRPWPMRWLPYENHEPAFLTTP